MLKEKRKHELLDFAKSLKLQFSDIGLLNLALTHKSYTKERFKKISEDNERLEFFGDAILKLYISEYLMSKYVSYAEGKLSKIRAYVVSEKVLAGVAGNLNFKKYLLLGKNERIDMPVSILADSLEALLAVIYYECGASKVKEFILNHWVKYIDFADKNCEGENFKELLQEYMQGNDMGLPVYQTLHESGPDHNKEFEVGVYLNDNEIATGCGKTKKLASQEAAKKTLLILKHKNEN